MGLVEGGRAWWDIVSERAVASRPGTAGWLRLANPNLDPNPKQSK